MRTYQQDVEIEIEEILMDATTDLPTPSCPLFAGQVTVTVSGKDTPARIFCRNEDACPAEYREAEADKCASDLAWDVWTAYDKQVGPLSLAQRDAFLIAAESFCRVAIDDAECRALEQDNEPPEPEYDTFRERDERYAD